MTVSTYSIVGARVRANLRLGHETKDLVAIARELQRSCETLDLSAIGVVGAIRDEKYGEAQLRSDAVERCAEDLLARAQMLAIRVRDARLSRSTAA